MMRGVLSGDTIRFVVRVALDVAVNATITYYDYEESIPSEAIPSEETPVSQKSLARTRQ